MGSSILSIVFACLCWGLVFVLPSWIKGFGPIEISIGRFFVYGFVCLLWLLLTKRHLMKESFFYWKKAAIYGFSSTLLCYTCMMFGMKYATPAMTTLIYAMSPMTIAFFGNFKKKEYSYKKFAVPSLLMFLGIIISNLGAFQGTKDSVLLYIVGLLAAMGGLASWTWYAVDNSGFMEKNPQIKVNDWSVMMGSSTFFLVLALAGISLCFSSDISHMFRVESGAGRFLVGCIMLGTVSTSFAFYFWNQGAKKLPISLVGQLMMLEVIFGLLLLYLFEQRIPSLSEILGIVFMLSGVIIGSRLLMGKQSQEQTS